MVKTPDQFYQTYKGKRIDDDGAYGVQCVDAFRVFCKWAFRYAYPTGTGRADGYWYQRGQHADQFTEVSRNQLKDGDWVFWKVGSRSHPDSHVAMYYHGQEFGQNQSADRGFCLKPTDFSDILGGLRWKGFEPAKPVFKEIKPVPYAVFRLYNKSNGDHFYTADVKEANRIKKAGWNDEGIAWYHDDHGAPVYRLYNPNTGEHFYTASSHERAGLVKAGWKYERIAFGSGKGSPVYRLYNPNGKHFFTISESEKNNLMKAGWKYEGSNFRAKGK